MDGNSVHCFFIMEKQAQVKISSTIILLFIATVVFAQPVTITDVAEGWASNSVNAVVFRKNSLASNNEWQYTAFYNADKYVVLGKRKLGAPAWQLQTTAFRGNAADAHNTISIMLDGDGYLHLAWDHHNNPLNYSRSIAPNSLEMSPKMPMTGMNEDKVSYPEFYCLSTGDLVFLYRDGGSGKGNLVINSYSRKNKKWKQLHSNLVDGEGMRNAYWQACTDIKGSIHLSWVWRESPDVASNHDMCYARSDDGGITWVKSSGEKYDLPVNASTAEYALRIPQKSELINQTSMCANEKGEPFIATYWREKNDSVPQFHIVFKENGAWENINTRFRKTPFSLSGQGTKKIPISRPQVIASNEKGHQKLAIIYRDEERNNRVTVATCTNMNSNEWTLQDLTSFPVGSWEPTYDTQLWKRSHVLNLFLQEVDQADAEGLSASAPKMVRVLEWKPVF